MAALLLDGESFLMSRRCGAASPYRGIEEVGGTPAVPWGHGRGAAAQPYRVRSGRRFALLLVDFQEMAHRGGGGQCDAAFGLAGGAHLQAGFAACGHA